MPFTGSREPGKSVLPSFLLWPTLASAAWVAIAPYVWLDGVSNRDAALAGALPGAVAFAFTLADYVLWRRRGRPWHDWTVILLLLPAIAAGVWGAVGALALDTGLSREGLLGAAVGPGVALVGLLTTTISYHGRHHPDEYRAAPAQIVRILSGHAAPDRPVLRVEAGERLSAGELDTTWPAFRWCTRGDGVGGWIPDRYLRRLSPEWVVAERAYDTSELTVAAGAEIEVVERDDESGWLWARDAAGREGWLPLGCVEAVAEDAP